MVKYTTSTAAAQNDQKENIVSEEQNNKKKLDTISNLTELDAAEIQLTKDNLPANMQLYFSLKLFSPDERFVHFLRCSFIPFRAANAVEK